MPGKIQIGSQRAEAARLSGELGIEVTRDMVREWQRKGYPLEDTAALRLKLKNQERNSLPAPESQPPRQISPTDLDAEIERLRVDLLMAPDYETSRTLTTKIRGMKDVHAVLIAQGSLVSRESQAADGQMAAMIVQQLFLKIVSDLPPMLAGMTALQMVEPLTDYAHSQLEQLADASTYFQKAAAFVP